MTRLKTLALPLMLAAMAPAAANAAQGFHPQPHVSPANCRIEVRPTGNGGGQMRAYAARHLSGRYEFNGVQMATSGLIVFDQSGWFSPSSNSRTLLMSAYLRTSTQQPAARAMPGMAFGQRYHEQPVSGMYGVDVAVEADLTVYDVNGNVVCRDRLQTNAGRPLDLGGSYQ